MSLINHIHRTPAAGGNRIAMVAGTRSWTYAELAGAVQQLADSLRRLGVRRGDRVALQLSNSPELVLAYYACFQLGAVSVPINNRFAPAELSYSLKHSASRICISQANLYAGVEAIRSDVATLEHVFLVDGDRRQFRDVRPFWELLAPAGNTAAFPEFPSGAVAAILYTSGTTSRPKGVTHTHHSLDATARLHATQIGLGPHDVVCVIPPMCHILGFATQMMASLWAGARIVLLPGSEPETILRTIEGCQATRIAALPTLYQSLINHPGAGQFSLRSLRTCIAGGDAVPIALQENFRATFGVQLLEGCGMTEVIPFTLNLPGDCRMGPIGRPCPGVTIRLADDHGKDVPLCSPGEILVRSETQMIGYWNEPDLSATALAEGFVHTGDLARLDEDGFYWFTGRKKDIIIRGGSNISPLEVEEAIYQHPSVRECGVVGMPDPELTEIVCAYVAARCPIAPEDLQEFLRTRIAPYKVPEVIRFLPELPKGVTGKVDRRSLRKQAAGEQT